MAATRYSNRWPREALNDAPRRVVLAQTVDQGASSIWRWTMNERRPAVRTWRRTSAPDHVTRTLRCVAVVPRATDGLPTVARDPARSGPFMKTAVQNFLPVDACTARPTPT